MDRYELMGFDPYQRAIELSERLEEDEQLRQELLEYGQEQYGIENVIRQFGTWVVTKYGLECLTDYYPIRSSDIFGHDGNPYHSWPQHMAEKIWVNLPDFLKAYDFARVHFRPSAPPVRPPERMPPARAQRGPITLSLRFAILRRDEYRCRLCGKTAKQGATLEVDHRVPVSKGGLTEASNLWTLCFACNRGKSAKDL